MCSVLKKDFAVLDKLSLVNIARLQTHLYTRTQEGITRSPVQNYMTKGVVYEDVTCAFMTMGICPPSLPYKEVDQFINDMDDHMLIKSLNRLITGLNDTKAVDC